MGNARHPKTYEGEKSQVTIPWKRRVIAKLKVNKAANVTPANIDQLKEAVGASKGGLNKLLKLTGAQQLTGAYVMEISKLLDVTPPVLETDDDDPDFARDVLLLRSVDPELRRVLMTTAEGLRKRG